MYKFSAGILVFLVSLLSMKVNAITAEQYNAVRKDVQRDFIQILRERKGPEEFSQLYYKLYNSYVQVDAQDRSEDMIYMLINTAYMGNLYSEACSAFRQLVDMSGYTDALSSLQGSTACYCCKEYDIAKEAWMHSYLYYCNTESISLSLYKNMNAAINILLECAKVQPLALTPEMFEPLRDTILEYSDNISDMSKKDISELVKGIYMYYNSMMRNISEYKHMHQAIDSWNICSATEYDLYYINTGNSDVDLLHNVLSKYTMYDQYPDCIQMTNILRSKAMIMATTTSEYVANSMHAITMISDTTIRNEGDQCAGIIIWAAELMLLDSIKLCDAYKLSEMVYGIIENNKNKSLIKGAINNVWIPAMDRFKANDRRMWKVIEQIDAAAKYVGE